MEDQINRLVEKAWAKFQAVDPSQRLLIAISGIPGSGKTTVSKQVTSRLNALYKSSSASASHSSESAPEIASFIPMDGFHLSRAQLSSMPDPTHAHDRRGAEFTFDGDAFLRLVKSVRVPLTASSTTLYAPSFDHAVKDPVQDDIPIPATSRIVVFEGNYLSLNKEPWREAAELMDELWFVEVDFEVAGQRLASRHVEAGIATDVEDAWKRIRGNDLLNGEQIVKERMEVHEVVVSK